MKCIPFALTALPALLISVNSFAGESTTLQQQAAVVSSEPGTDDWRFSVTMPGWLAGLKGDFGVGGLEPVHADVPFTKILQHLDMVGALTVEAQHGPWSFYVDGLYMKLSVGGETPGPLLNGINLQMREALVEAGVGYRLWEGKRGYFDLLAGARYLYMGTTVQMDVNSRGVRDVSEQLAGIIVDRVSSVVSQKSSAALADAKSSVSDALATAKSDVSNRAFELKQNASNAIEAEARARIQTKIDDTLAKYPRLPSVIKGISESNGPVSDALKQLLAAKIEQKKADIADAQAALSEQIQAGKAAGSAAAAAARAALNEKVQTTKAEARARVDKAVRKAEHRLAQQIETAIRKAIPEEVSGSKGWVDPFVGFRARYNFTDQFYAAARADIGGFGVSSKLAWQAFGALGYQFNNHWSSELGYRYLAIDYEKSGFVYDAGMGGAFVGLTYKF